MAVIAPPGRRPTEPEVPDDVEIADSDVEQTTVPEPDEPPPRRGLGARIDAGIQSPHMRRGLYAAAGVLSFLVLVRFIFRAPPEILFSGAILGSLSGLVAMGLVLIYRSDRIINFAQGDLGGTSGVLMASIFFGTSLPIGVAIFAGLAAGIGTGALVQIVLIRRFADAPRLILTVVTILTSTFLAFIQLIIPQWFDLTFAPQGEMFPFQLVEWEFGVLRFRTEHFVVLLMVPLIVVGLNMFFRYSRLGKAVRASAESKNRALLLGIPVKQVNLAVWVIAAGLSAVAAVLRTFIVGAPIGSVLGTSLLIPAIAAAVVAKMENLWLAFGASIVIGMISDAVLFSTSRTAAVPPVLFGIVLAALLIQSRGKISRADDTGISSFSALREVRPIPPELRDLAVVRRGFMALRIPIFLALVVWPLFLGPGRIYLMSVGIATGLVALSLVILTGWTGQISLGQWGFAGVGGAVAGAMHNAGWNVLLCVFCGALAGAVIAMVIGIPALRIRGLFLAVATITFTIAAGSFFLSPQEFSWIPAARLPERPLLFNKFDLETEHTFYYFSLIILGVVLLSMKSIRASRIGRVFLAVRDNERGAQAFSVNVLRAKLTAFAMSGFVAALGGALFVLLQHNRLSIQLGAEENLRLFEIAVVGGLGSVTGVLASVVLFQIVDFVVPSPEFRLLFNFVGVLIILTAYPSGLGGMIYDVRDSILRRVARVRGIHVPSLVADSRQVDEQDEASLADVHVDDDADHVVEHYDVDERPRVDAAEQGGRR